MLSDAQSSCYVHQRMNTYRERFYGIGVVRYTRAGVPRLASSTNKYGLVGRSRLVSTSQFVQPVERAGYSNLFFLPAGGASHKRCTKAIPVNLDGAPGPVSR